jgi:hypothetical protein
MPDDRSMTNKGNDTNSTVAWMISGGRRFNDTWAEGIRHRTAIEEARTARPSIVGSVADRIRSTVAPEPESEPSCCPA